MVMTTSDTVNLLGDEDASLGRVDLLRVDSLVEIHLEDLVVTQLRSLANGSGGGRLRSGGLLGAGVEVQGASSSSVGEDIIFSAGAGATTNQSRSSHLVGELLHAQWTDEVDLSVVWVKG